MDNNSWQDKEFTIQVDEVINQLARCEFPDEEMRDVPIYIFPFEPKEFEKYQMKYDENGHLIFISRSLINSDYRNKRIRPKWMRFPRRR